MSLKVLIIEPNTVRQRQLKSMLTMLGNKAAEIDVTEDHRHCLSHVRKKRYDCCFVEMELHGKNCIELVEEIRSCTTLNPLPVVVMGSGATKEAVLGIVQAGASGFLAVPLTLEAVEQALRQAVGYRA